MSENGKWFLMFLITLLSVIVPVIIFGISRENKCLTYEVTGGGILFKGDILKTEDIKVIYKNEELENLDFQFIKIVNEGKIPIKRQDFDKDLVVSYPKETRVLSAKVLKSKPDNLEIKLKTNGNDIQLEPLLLNKDDSVEIQVLSTNKRSDPTLNARIIGLDKITCNKPSSTRITLTMNIYLVLSLLAAFLYGTTPILIVRRTIITIPKFLIILIVISSLMASINLNNRYATFNNLYWGSWPSYLVFAFVGLGFLYAMFFISPKSSTNYRME